MNVLVTGGAGFIGSHVVRALVERGDHVRVLDALTQPVHPIDADPKLDADLIRGDVRERDVWVRALEGIEAVVHLAAYQDYGLDFSRFAGVNVTGTALMFELIVEAGLPVRRVVVASSQAVYGEGQVRCETHGIVAAAQRRPEALARGDFEAKCSVCLARGEPVQMNEDFANPHNTYGVSKHATEQLALVLGELHEIPTVALRYAIVHGPGQSPRNAYSGLLRGSALSLLVGRAPVVFEDGGQLRDYVAIDDAVSATLTGLDHPGAPGRAYNVGGARSWTVLEMLDALNEIVPESRAPEIGGAFRLGDVRHTLADIGALRALGWEPSTDLVQTWRRYWDWLIDQDLPADIVGEALEQMRQKGILRASDI